MRSRLRAGLAALGAAALLLAACGGSDSSAGSPSPGDRAGVDWAARTVDLDLPAGWSVEFCEGAGPFLCVARDGTPLGAAELLDFHRASLDGFDGDLGAFARQVYETIAADRGEGCPAGYRFEPDEVVPTTVAGREGVRYAFTGYMPDGRAVERGVGYSVLVGDVVYTLGANAYEPDGCVGTEGGEFTVAGLESFEPLLSDVAGQSELPERGGDGTVSGYVRALQPSGTVTVDPARILSGEEAVLAARDAGVIGPDEELETDFFVLDPDDTTFDLHLTDRTDVQLLDCTGGCEPLAVPVADFLSGQVRPYDGDGAVLSFTLTDGDVVSVVEQYLP